MYQLVHTGNIQLIDIIINFIYHLKVETITTVIQYAVDIDKKDSREEISFNNAK